MSFFLLVGFVYPTAHTYKNRKEKKKGVKSKWRLCFYFSGKDRVRSHGAHGKCIVEWAQSFYGGFCVKF